MTLYTKKEISDKLIHLAKRIDSILEFTHLELTHYDVKFLKGLSKRFLSTRLLDLEINIDEEKLTCLKI